MNTFKVRVPCFDQTDACPSNKLAGHNGMALGNLREGEGSQGRRGFDLVAVVAPRGLAPLFRGGDVEEGRWDKADRDDTHVVLGEGKRVDRGMFVSLTLVVFCCFSPAGLGCLFFLPVLPSVTMAVADCLLLSGRCGGGVG